MNLRIFREIFVLFILYHKREVTVINKNSFLIKKQYKVCNIKNDIL